MQLQKTLAHQLPSMAILQNKSSFFDYILIFFLFIFSAWFMDKGFRYDTSLHTFLIARNVIGDYGLHLGLIRSFSLGNNIPAQLPFFPGEPLPYHYYFDFLVGILEYLGLRIDVAWNGLSAIVFTMFLYLLYRFPQMLFKKKSKFLGLASLLLFIFPSSFTFLDFIKTTGLSPVKIIRTLWYMPDYIHKGPFDGSIISLYFTLNVYLNQRHLIFALMVSFGILYIIIVRLQEEKEISFKTTIMVGVILGVLFRIHSLICLGTIITLFFLCLLYKKYKIYSYIIGCCSLIILFQIHDIFFQKVPHAFLNPGFLATHPLTSLNVFLFWFLNLGIAFFLIPLSLFFVKKEQLRVFFSFLPIFILPNIIQFSYRIEHNHSLFNFFFTFTNFYIAFLITYLWEKQRVKKIVSIFLLIILIISGVINVFPIKNDYHYPFVVNPKNKFMQWIISQTKKDAIFLKKADILDEVVLSGRRNYLGNAYYLSVMGYNYADRAKNTKDFFEAQSVSTLVNAKKEKIDYIVIPKLKEVVDFPYKTNTEFLKSNLDMVYSDKDIVVFKL